MSGAFPPVSTAEAIDDACWFDVHPRCNYRARGGWLIRKVHDDVFLRTFSGNAEALTDTDAELGPVLFAAAWQLSSPAANRKSRQAGVRRAGGRR